MWNLYDLFVDFFEVRGIPLGALFLIDAGLNEEYLNGLRSGSHKLKWIQTVMDTYRDLPFILIGDSGEKDPEIYLQVVQQSPGRVLAVYIRNVYGKERDREKRERQVRDIIEAVNRAGADMLLVPDTYAAALHAAERGYISAESLTAIRAAQTEDNNPPTPTEALVDEIEDESTTP
jgi:phosphatidate phosphatase APP1